MVLTHTNLMTNIKKVINVISLTYLNLDVLNIQRCNNIA